MSGENSFFTEIVRLRLEVDGFLDDSKRAMNGFLSNINGLKNGAAAAAKILLEPIKQAARETAELEERAFEKYLAQRKVMAKINADVAQAQIQQEKEVVAQVSRATEQELRDRKKAADAEVRMEREAADARLRVRIEAMRYEQRLRLAQLREQRAMELAEARGNRPNMTVGRGLGTLAGGAAMMGQYNVAGAMYMAERLSYAGGIGNSGLGILATGAGAATIAIAGTAAAVAGLTYASYKLVENGSELSKGLADMSTLLGPVNGGLDGMNAKLNSLAVSADILSTKFNIDILDVVKGFKQALSTGVSADFLGPFMEQVAIAKNALNVSLEDSVQIMTSLKDAYRIAPNDIQTLATANDRLFNIINVGKVDVSQLATSMTKLLGPAANAGISIESLGGAFATLTRVMTPYQSGTAVASFINHIINPSKGAQKELERLGIAFGDVAFSSRTAGHEIEEMLNEIIVKTGGSPELIGKIFPEAQARKAVANLKQMNELLHENTTAMQMSGTAADANARALASLPATLEHYTKAFSNMAQIVGHDLQAAILKAFFGEQSATVGAMKFSIELQKWVPPIETFVLRLSSALAMMVKIAGYVPSVLSAAKYLPNPASGALNAAGALFGDGTSTGDDALDTQNIITEARRKGELVAQQRKEAAAAAGVHSDNIVTGVKPESIEEYGERLHQADIANKFKEIKDAAEEMNKVLKGSAEPIELMGHAYQHLSEQLDMSLKHKDFAFGNQLIKDAFQAYAQNEAKFNEIKESLSEEDRDKQQKILDEQYTAVTTMQDRLVEAMKADAEKEIKAQEAKEKRLVESENKIANAALKALENLENKKLAIYRKAEEDKKKIAKKIEDDIAEIEQHRFKSKLDERGDPAHTQRMYAAQISDDKSKLNAAAAAGDYDEANRLRKAIEDGISEFKSAGGQRIEGSKISDIEQDIEDAFNTLKESAPAAIDTKAKADVGAISAKSTEAIKSAVQEAIKNAAVNSINNSGNTTNNVGVNVSAKILGIDPAALRSRIKEEVEAELKAQVQQRNDQVDTKQGSTYPVGADDSRSDEGDSAGE